MKKPFMIKSLYYNGQITISKVSTLNSGVNILTSSIDKPTIKSISTQNPVLK